MNEPRKEAAKTLRERVRALVRRKFLRDTFTLQASSMVNNVGNLASTIALAHILGSRVQGQFYVALSAYALLFFLLNLGLQSATVSQVAAASARGLTDKVAAWLGFLTKAYALVGSILVVLGLLVLPPFAVRYMHLDAATAAVAGWLTLTPFFELPKIVVCAALQGTRRMVPMARIENCTELTRFVLVVIGAIAMGDARGPLLGTLATSLLSSVVALFFYSRTRAAGAALPPWREILGHARDVPLSYGLPLGLRLGLVRSIDALGTQILPTLILQHVGQSSEAVAYMRNAQRLLQVPLLLMQAVSRNLLPMFSELAALKEMERFRKNFVRACLGSGAIISGGVLLVLPFVPWGVSVFYPPDYHEPVTNMVLILVPGFLVLSFSIANDIFYLVTNTLRVAMILGSVGLVVNCVALWYLAGVNDTYGVAWGLSVTYASTGLHLVYEALWFRRHRRETALPAHS